MTDLDAIALGIVLALAVVVICMLSRVSAIAHKFNATPKDDIGGQV